MVIQSLPAVDGRYTTSQGDTFVVIGMGTKGIVVEYRDGRVELISRDRWDNLGAVYEEQTRH